MNRIMTYQTQFMTYKYQRKLGVLQDTLSVGTGRGKLYVQPLERINFLSKICDKLKLLKELETINK